MILWLRPTMSLVANYNEVMIIAWPPRPAANYGRRNQQRIVADTAKSEASSESRPAKDMADGEPIEPSTRPMADCGEHGSSRFPDCEEAYLLCYDRNRGCFVQSGKVNGSGHCAGAKAKRASPHFYRMYHSAQSTRSPKQGNQGKFKNLE